eukprot:COSAG01_NODE_7258_length_3279_cov_16.342453_2_plen_352_part_00
MQLMSSERSRREHAAGFCGRRVRYSSEGKQRTRNLAAEMHAPPACDDTSLPAGQPAAKLLAARPPLHTLDSEALIRWAREYGVCVEEKGLASVARACREAGLDGAALCGVPNADVLREVYKIEEWGVRIKLMNRARTYRRAAEQQEGAPASTDRGAAAAAEGNRRSRAAELTSAMPSAPAATTPPAGSSAPFAFKMPGLVAGTKPAFSFGAAASRPAGGRGAFVFTASKTPAGLSVPSKVPEFTSKMPRTPEGVGAVVQALLHRTPTTSPPWPVRCLCFSRTVGTSVQLSVRAWCPNKNCDSSHLHRIATSRGCSRRRRGSCSPRWPTRDWRRYATHARASAWHGKVPPAS